MSLREKVARAKYEEKRARLIEAFGSTAGWPEWESLKDTLKEIQMEEYDAAIALVLEEAVKVAELEAFRLGSYVPNNHWLFLCQTMSYPPLHFNGLRAELSNLEATP